MGAENIRAALEEDVLSVPLLGDRESPCSLQCPPRPAANRTTQ